MMPDSPEVKPRLSDSRFFLVAFPACLLLVLFLAWLLPLHYSTVDDVEMEGIASGALTGMPEFRLVFIHAFLGKTLQALYEWIPQIPWYADYFLLCNALSLALLITYTRHATPIAGIAATSAAFCIHFYVLTDLQFTTTASLLGTWAIAWFWKLSSRKQFRLADGMWVVAFLALFLAWMLRREAVAFSFIALAPMFLMALSRPKGSWLPRLGLPLVAVALLLASSYADHRMQYDDPAWARFREYNMRRGLLQDAHTVHYSNFSQAATKVGWSEAEFAVFDEFLSDGAAPFSFPTINALYHEVMAGLNRQVNWAGINVTVSDLFRYYRYPLLLSLLVLTIACLAGRRAWSLWPVPVLTLVLLAIQGHYFGSKDRLIVSSLTQITIASLAFLALYGEAILHVTLPRRKRPAMILVFLALAVSGFSARASLINARIRHDALQQQVSALDLGLGSYADGRVLLNLDAYPKLINDPFRRLTRPRAGATAQVIPLGWYAASPYQRQLAGKAGLSPDSSLLLQLTAGPGRFFLGTEQQAGLVRAFLRDRSSPTADTLSFGAFPYMHGRVLRVYKFRD